MKRSSGQGAASLRRAGRRLFADHAARGASPSAAPQAQTTVAIRRSIVLAVARAWGASVPDEGTVAHATIDLPRPEPDHIAWSLGAVYEGLLELEVAPDGRVIDSIGRRRAGAHFTSPEVADDVARRALAPLVAARARGPLFVCDPAMGSGVFLSSAARFLSSSLGVDLPCAVADWLFGIDRDPTAVLVARIALAHLGGLRPEDLEARLVSGDAVVSPGGAPAELASEALSWEDTFPHVFARGGFDAVVGNPPWVAYAGRAAQPLSPSLHAYFRARYPAFAGYRTLHGLFVSRAAEVLAPGGRLGLVVPTSMADLAGYAPARGAHDALARPDEDLPDYGADAFDGVFQPAMAILSTRRAAAEVVAGDEWALARADLDDATRAILERCDRLGRVPPELFGERGFQTSSGDLARLSATPVARRTVGLRAGKDVRPFELGPPSLFADPAELGGRLRDPDVWRAVAGYVRQTARYPMAAQADGTPFRNSILAVFGVAELPTDGVLAYLNSWPLRFLHYMRFRDARQGMPQLKIGHLRSLPIPAGGGPWLGDLARLGRSLGARNDGIDAESQARIDSIVSDALGLDAGSRERVARFSREEGAMVRPRASKAPSSPAPG